MARKGRGWDAKPSDPSRAASRRRGPAQSTPDGEQPIPDGEADPFGVDPQSQSSAPDPDDPFGLTSAGGKGGRGEDPFGADPYAGGADPAAFTAAPRPRSRGRDGEGDEPEKPPRRKPPGEVARLADLLGAEAAEFARTRKPATGRRKQPGANPSGTNPSGTNPLGAIPLGAIPPSAQAGDQSSRDLADRSEPGVPELPARRSLPWSTASSPPSTASSRPSTASSPQSGEAEPEETAKEPGKGRGRWGKTSGWGARRGGSGGEREGRRGARERPGTEDGDTPENADPYELAREICLRQLATRPRTRKELALAMRKRGVEQEVADAVLDRYGEVGMIDDAAFARAWVSSRHHSKGLAGRALAQELRQRGVEQEVAQEALSELDSDTEAATALDLAMRKLRSTRGEPEAVFRRLVGMLARKGYSGGVAVRAVKEALATRDAELADLIDPDVYEE